MIQWSARFLHHLVGRYQHAPLPSQGASAPSMPPQPARMPPEILTLIGYYLDQSSLLRLALVCQRLRDIVIPRLLFRHVLLVNHGAIISFCHMLLALDPTAGTFVRSLDCVHRAPKLSPANAWLIVQTLRRMTNILRVNIPIPFYEYYPDLLIVLSSFPKLRHLSLGINEAQNLSMIPRLPELRALHVTLDSFAKISASSPLRDMSHHSPLGSVLLHSRNTLEDIKLDLAAFMPAAGSTLTFTWPSVRLLDFGSLALGRWEHLDLSVTFPAVRHFVAPLKNRATWHTRNPTFLAGLTSLEGDWKVLRAAVAAGALLQRVVGRWQWTPEVDLGVFPSTLGCLALRVAAEDFEALIHHVNQTPFASLKVFALTIVLDRNAECDYTSMAEKVGAVWWCADLEFISVNFKAQRTVDKSARVQCWHGLAERLPWVRFISVRIAAETSVWETSVPGKSKEPLPSDAVAIADFYCLRRWTEPFITLH
ncbi:hypothetical protein BOTBODRAFT_191345 [Botryobasidium botryosum FD-172 SS1]|uniref:F-box domain-containing protein n=1 Tax=Botryobasidium botryosum (strain FD-172 SS1) TaxID=930990 RepID=A0A067M0E5_BOTB1|nr:hypothetical protein BOTBODRAFT_191345 [Botryobasidium botryosum FD-172 SS1]